MKKRGLEALEGDAGSSREGDSALGSVIDRVGGGVAAAELLSATSCMVGTERGAGGDGVLEGAVLSARLEGVVAMAGLVGVGAAVASGAGGAGRGGLGSLLSLPLPLPLALPPVASTTAGEKTRICLLFLVLGKGRGFRDLYILEYWHKF